MKASAQGQAIFNKRMQVKRKEHKALPASPETTSVAEIYCPFHLLMAFGVSALLGWASSSALLSSQLGDLGVTASSPEAFVPPPVQCK